MGILQGEPGRNPERMCIFGQDNIICGPLIGLGAACN